MKPSEWLKDKYGFNLSEMADSAKESPRSLIHWWHTRRRRFELIAAGVAAERKSD